MPWCCGMNAISAFGSPDLYAMSMPALTWLLSSVAEVSGSSSSCRLSPPAWFSMKAAGFESLPTSW